MYLNVWQPRLAYGGGVQGFFVGHRGYHYASTALMDPMTKAFVADIHGFVAARGLDLVSFAKGQRKDDLAQEFLAKFTDDEGVLFVGRAQEKASVCRTQRRRNPVTGSSYAWLVRSTAVINYSTSTAWTRTSALSSSSSAPTSPTRPGCASTATSGSSGTGPKAGIGFNPWTTASLLRRPGPWPGSGDLRRPSARHKSTRCCANGWRPCPIPSPLSDRKAGYLYESSILQAEFALTQMLDRPVSGRIFFEQVIRDNLAAGDQTRSSLIFNRRIHRQGHARDRAVSAPA